MSDAQLLAEAKDALHKLNLGKAVRVIQKDGRRIEYTPADRRSLEIYIQSLEGTRRGPAGIC